jgi:hypothetical protein
MNWLSDQVIQAAQSVELAGGTVRSFRQGWRGGSRNLPLRSGKPFFGPGGSNGD